MMLDTLVGQLGRHGAAAADAAVARLAAALVTIAEAELPGVAATRDDAGVQLRAPGLRARALGTRRDAADPRLRGLLALFRTTQVLR